MSIVSLTLLLSASILPQAAAPTPSGDSGGGGAAQGRVIVLGMDGMDSRKAAEWMDAGLLPNFARLRDQGTFAPFMPANPAQSPVSWATINTGCNPGKTGIFDFIGVFRDNPRGSGMSVEFGFTAPRKVTAAEAGLPFADPKQVWGLLGGSLVLGGVLFLGLRRRSRPLAVLLGLAVAGGGAWYAWSWRDVYPESGFTDYSRADMEPDFWEVLDQAGVPFRGQGTIVSYPVQELEHGKLIAGLGAPDATGGLNSSALWTTADERVRHNKTYRPQPAWTEEDAPTPTSPSGTRAGTVYLYRLQAGDEPGTWRSKLIGPFNQWRREQVQARIAELDQALASSPSPERAKERSRLKALASGGRDLMRTWVPMEVRWSRGDEAVELTVDGVAQTIPLGSWSDFYFVEFPWNDRFSTHAMVRFWAEEVDGELELFASPLQIDPDHPTPGSKICWPPGFAAEVKERIGPFETLGWACQTHAVKDAELSDDAFLADIEFTYGWRRRMLEDAMQDDDWRVLFHFFGSPDRVCHMLMRHFDPKHPEYDPALAGREVEFFGERMPIADTWLKTYQQMDDVVGWLLDEAMGPDDVLLVVSDHGFDSFRRQVQLNNWLVREGFAALDDHNRLGQPKTAREIATANLNWADWSRTQAYSAAIGKIYLNLKGREKYGIVDPAEADAVMDEIEARLMELTDPETGEKIVRRVYRKHDIYQGPWIDPTARPEGAPRLPAYEGAAELTIDFAPGYRAAWSVTDGRIGLEDVETEDGALIAAAKEPVYDNTSPWSGDHCGVDLAQVQGIFFSSRPAALPAGADHYDAVHLAPTVLRLMGVAVPDEVDGAPLRVE